MSETLGGLVDRLSIVNIKLWFVQDQIHQAEKRGQGLDAETVRKLVHLNLERNRLMTEIDELAASGKFRIDSRIKLT